MATNSATAIGSRAELPLWIRDDTIAGRGLHRDGKSVCLAQGVTMASHTVKECAALFRRAVGGLTVLILALISTNGPGQEEGKQAEQLRTGAQHTRANERIVTDPDGAKVVYILSGHETTL